MIRDLRPSAQVLASVRITQRILQAEGPNRVAARQTPTQWRRRLARAQKDWSKRD